LGGGDWALAPLPIPQSPIPNPQSPWFYMGLRLVFIKNYKYN